MISTLATFIGECLSLLHQESSVDDTFRGKISRMIAYAFAAIVFLCISALTWKSYTLTVHFEKYKKEHPHTVEECVAKNQYGASSDSGTGLTTPSTWEFVPKGTPTKECIGSWCFESNFPSKEAHEQYRATE